MPFTLAHPAAGIALLRPLGRFGVLSALAIGAMAPDLAFVTGFPAERELTHSLAGLLVFTLPAGVLAYCLFHMLLKAPLSALLPARLLQRLPTRTVAPSAIAVVISLLVGALTHLACDAFTHLDTPVTNTFPSLATHLGNLGDYQLYVHNLLQHGGTLAGIALMALWLRRWLADAPLTHPCAMPLPVPVRVAVIGALLALPTEVGLRTARAIGPPVTDFLSGQSFALIFAFSFMPAFTAALLAYGVAWRVLARETMQR